ncbi:MAG: hypothetical protein ACPGJF_03175 [Sinimarinibacterium flocculans]|uniref:hypothetical protein n=1 Tax=Sinimarinibacterium flocculans TaxID=985250 RepID=UPI003C326CEE
MTVYLSAPVAPGNRDHVSGELRKHDSLGVWVFTATYEIGGRLLFFPTHQIQRIEYNR